PTEYFLIRTGGGGFHVPIDLDTAESVLGRRITAVRSSLRMELFGRSGYVLVPPSVSEKGRYVLLQGDRVLNDRALIARLLAPFRPSPAGEQLTSACEAVKRARIGERHPTFIQMASGVFEAVSLGDIPAARAESRLREAYAEALPDELADLERCLADAK